MILAVFLLTRIRFMERIRTRNTDDKMIYLKNRNIKARKHNRIKNTRPKIIINKLKKKKKIS